MSTKSFRLALDVGGTNLAAAVVDQEYHILSRESIPAGAGRSIDEITSDMAKVSRMAVQKAGLTLEDMSFWGIGMPSCVNSKTNLLVHANCFGWKNVPIYDYLKKHMPLPVRVENDANAAAYGELIAGAARGYKNALMVTLGTGVGGGIIIDGKIYAGADNMGGQIGHTKLVYDGELCTCGQKGCLEAYCSATALIKFAKRAGLYNSGSKEDAQTVFRFAKEGNPLAMKLIDDYVSYLAAGLSSLIAIFRPEIIIIGGGVSAAGEQLFVPLRQKLENCTFGAAQSGLPPVVCAELGNDAGLIGAAYLDMQNQ